jgi:hypothetical protein
MTTTPSNLSALVTHIAERLTDAAEHEMFGDHAAHMSKIDAAAQALGLLFEHEPHEVPPAVATLAALAPAVRPSDLHAAVGAVQAAYQSRTDDYAVVLHPDCLMWVNAAVDEYGADAAAVIAWLCIEPTAGPVRRPGDLPVSDTLRSLVGAATWADLTAAQSVHTACVDALARSSDGTTELLELIEERLLDDLTVEEAINDLTGPARIRAEELLAQMPSILTVHR